MHDDLDLNGHGIHEVLSFRSDNIVLQKHLDFNNRVVVNGGVPLLKYEDNNITTDQHLNRSRLHLNRSGTSLLSQNFISYINSQ